MNRLMTAGACALLLCGFAIPASAKDESGGAWDGLVEVKPKRLDAAYLMPGADFRPYTKLMIDPVEVAFRKNWMRDVNDSASAGAAHHAGRCREDRGGGTRGV